jgi:hypothetical protein
MGIMRPVPFEQLVVGAYTTQQIEAGEENIREAVAAFNELITINGQYTQLKNELTGPASQNLRPDQMPTRFVTVPPDAPELLSVLEEFTQMLEHDHLELPDAWGAIIITQNQPDLKRVDMVVSWNAVEIEAGDVVLDSDGNPVLLPAVDEDSGEPLTDADGNMVPLRRIVSTHIFLHKDAAYFQ